MFSRISNEFAPEELTLLASVLHDHMHDAQGLENAEGLFSPEAWTELTAVAEKVQRLALIDKRVKFLHKDHELVGVLQEYRDWEGIPMAAIASRGHIYLVAQTQVIGVA